MSATTSIAPEHARHTPGPWEALPYTSLSKRIIVREDRRDGIGVFELSPIHADNGEQLIPFEQFEANARLALAAPDLLAALTRLESAWAQNLGDLHDALDTARAAIARAEGRTP
jgi:hypothetical protein